MMLELVVFPSEHLHLEHVDAGDSILSKTAESRLCEAFSSGCANGIEVLASEFLTVVLPPSLAFGREIGRRYLTALCHTPVSGDSTSWGVSKPCLADFDALAESAPPMKGLEYLSGAVLSKLWDELDCLVRDAVANTPGGVSAWLRQRNPVWNSVGRVTFHLAENKRNSEYPFAFLATYTHRVSDQGQVRHIPLDRALEEYAGAGNRAALRTLLSPVQRAAELSEVARELLDSHALFHPQVWTPAQAYRFLKDIPHFEQSGVQVRIPDWWKSGRPPRPQVSVRIGEVGRGGLMGAESLLDFDIGVSLEGEVLSAEELESILKSAGGLVLLKGKWVEANPEKLREVLAHWRRVEASSEDGVTFLQGLRLLSGFHSSQEIGVGDEDESVAQWSGVKAGRWLEAVLEGMRSPQESNESDPGPLLCAQLRPYQRVGVHWLWFMARLGLGGCLADDMGLGKTIQVLSLLLVVKRQAQCREPSLLVVPASLIGNWKSEISKFAPSLSVIYAHPSESASETSVAWGGARGPSLKGCDLVITSYGMLLRLAWLKRTEWNLVILDEAQAIKNPAARQSRSVKELKCRSRIAMSGTPIENSLGDLWSLFDFLCPGLLGGAREFSQFVKQRDASQGAQFAALRRLVRPYILRRLKTDKRVIADLPEKTELECFCTLSRAQAVLYQQAVVELKEQLESPLTDGIRRRGIILAYLTRFKQICNHPSQWLGDGGYVSDQSGKFVRLGELCGEIASRQEKALVFTQYREMTRPLAEYLATVFGREGLVLSGETAVKKRKELVDAFQAEDGPPFFVLSLKAGGTGLNLTAASHVLHFDRWWNPAVENQATDRAFRIGQKRAVMVHKFICRGTIEERIRELIAGKMQLSEDLLGQGAERLLTEMSNADLLRFVALDIKAAVADE
jgi:non-specific serine/threonine protein kinase